MMPPRIRGRTAQIEWPEEDKGKWAYEMSLWDLNGEKSLGEPFLYGPYETEEIAKEKGREIVRQACEALGGDGKYLDLKNGAVLRPWDEQ